VQNRRFVMGLLPLDNFLCWKLKIATLAICIFTIVSASTANEFNITVLLYIGAYYCYYKAQCL